MEALAPVPGLNAVTVQDLLLDKNAIEHVCCRSNMMLEF